MDLIPALSPALQCPYHMKAMVDACESAESKPRRIVIAAPVQHGKSTTMLHWIVKLLLQNPKRKIVHASYADAFANSQSRICRELAKTAGIQFKDDLDTVFRWGTEAGGWVMFTSVGGAVTGYGADIVIIDDPFKNREEVERVDVRDKVFTWYQQTILPRIAPWTSIICVASRWHIDDLSGRLLKLGFDEVHLKAIQDDGTALWPAVRDLDFLRDQRRDMGDYAFAANFQGEPYLSGETKLGVPARYKFLPVDPGYRYAMGVDMAFSKERMADYFALAILLVYGDRGWVVRIERTKSDIDAIEARIRDRWLTYGQCPIYSYMSGPEVGWAEWLIKRGLPFHRMQARYNKIQRAEYMCRCWNDGRLMFPEQSEWFPPFYSRALAWRGLENDQSDEIDALVSAVDGGMSGSGFVSKTFGKPRI